MSVCPNEPISMKIGINLPPPGQWDKMVDLGVRGSKVKVTAGRGWIWRPGHTVGDGNVAMEKRGGMLHVV